MATKHDVVQAYRFAGEPIVDYRALPAPALFHTSAAKYRWLFGGNRSGKSEANIGYDLCTYALGVHHYRRTPDEAVIWAAADTWPLVGKLLWQEKIKLFLPKWQIAHISWHNRGDEIPKEVRLVNGNRIEFKAYEQGRTAFEGRKINAFYGDEQCKSDSLQIFQEVQARLIDDPDGFCSQSMTPIRAQPWLEDRINSSPDTDAVFYANLNDNRKSKGGHITDKAIDDMVDDWPDEVQATRIEGKFASFFGAVYKGFRRDVHVVEPFEIPTDWRRYRGIDFGYNNPFVCLWLARSPDNEWVVYSEHYRSRDLLAHHASAIKHRQQPSGYVATYADHDAQDRAELWEKGIETSPAIKDVNAGIEKVQSALKIRGNGKPRLTIFDTCPNVIREFSAYHYPEGTDAKDPKDQPVQVHDHAMDALRYVIYSAEYDRPLVHIVGGRDPARAPGPEAMTAKDLPLVEDMEDEDAAEKELLGAEIWDERK